ncbi:VOC family protein [Chloroflexota bacterium]
MKKERPSNISDLDQLVFVVKDIEKAAGFFEKVLGTEPFRYFDINFTEEMSRSLTRGKAAPGRIRKAIARKGQVIFNLNELVEGETLFKEYADARGEGLHSLAFYVDDLEKEVSRLEQEGVKVLHSGTTRSTGLFAFIGGEGCGGVNIRLLERSGTSLEERLTGLEKES